MTFGATIIVNKTAEDDYNVEQGHRDGVNKLSLSEEISRLSCSTSEPNNRVRVEVAVVFLKINHIDTLQERYQAEIILKAKWREPRLDATWLSLNPESNSNTFCDPIAKNENGMNKNVKSQKGFLCEPQDPSKTLDDIQEKTIWNPKLFIDNVKGEMKEESSLELEFKEPSHEAYVVEKRRIKGTFHETLELKHFPFDSQDLSITVVSELGVDEVELMPSQSEVSYVDNRCAPDTQEWSIFKHVEIKVFQWETPIQSNFGSQFQPGLVFTTRAARRFGFFLLNIIVISCLICFLSFTIFSVPPTENRLQLSLLLLLTIVTLKHNASQTVPKISYLTYLDTIIIFNLITMVLLTVWHAVVRVIITQYQPFNQELYVFIAAICLYIIGLLVFGLNAYFDAGKRKRDMKEKDRKFARYLEFVGQVKSKQWSRTYGLKKLLSSSPASQASVPPPSIVINPCKKNVGVENKAFDVYNDGEDEDGRKLSTQRIRGQATKKESFLMPKNLNGHQYDDSTCKRSIKDENSEAEFENKATHF